jgi:selenide, water dikinase
VLNGMPIPKPNPNVLVGGADWDDAGVIRVSPELALVHTVDFFTPIVDDPRDFGAVAAVNALSDVYAMGGTPVSALAIVCFPHKTLPLEVLADTMRGAAEILAGAEVSLLGGHSVKDPEFKFGFAVTGHVHPARIVRNRGAKPGDVLMLTKPIGTGILATAVKREQLDPETTAVLIRTLRTLNRAASQAMLAAGAHAATDVTGFGLLGHAAAMARPSEVTFVIHADQVPLLPRALEFLAAGVFPGGLEDNARGLAGQVAAGDAPAHRILFDPQTAGGLLVSLPVAEEGSFQQSLARLGAPPASRIGEVVARRPTWIEVQ